MKTNCAAAKATALSFSAFNILTRALVLVTMPLTALGTELDDNRNRTIESWKTLRDQGVVRQYFDYSCGAASIATLLTSHFNAPTSEARVLSLLPTVDRPYSLTDMAHALKLLGYESISLRVDAADLQKLTVPAVLFMHPRRTRTTVGHFVVLRNIGDASVTVADPASGNRAYAFDDFLSRWGTRDAEGKISGVLMLVRPTQHVPDTPNTSPQQIGAFFQRTDRLRHFRTSPLPVSWSLPD